MAQNSGQKGVFRKNNAKATARPKKQLTPDLLAASTLPAIIGTSIRSHSGRMLSQRSHFED
jgi:hypothetical protein